MRHGRDLAKTLPNIGGVHYMSNRHNWQGLVDQARLEAIDKGYHKVHRFLDRCVAFVHETHDPGPNATLRIYAQVQNGLRVVRYQLSQGLNLDHHQMSPTFVREMGLHLARSHSPRTSNGTVSFLNRFFEHLLRMGERPDNPVRRRHYPRWYRSGQSIVKPQDVMRYAELLARDGTFEGVTHGMALALCANTGLRMQELWRLKPSCFAERDRHLGPHLVIQGKKNKIRTAPLPSDFARLLKTYIRKFCGNDPSAFLFHEPMDRRFPLMVKRLEAALKRIHRAHPSLPHFTVTAARRGFATELFAQGVGLEVLIALFDHSRSNTTLHYIDREEAVQAKAVGRHHPLFREVMPHQVR